MTAWTAAPARGRLPRLGFDGRAGAPAWRPATVRSHEELVAAAVRWTVLLIPVNWICGTTPFWCFGVAAVLLARARVLSLPGVLLAGLMAALTAGLVMGVGRGAPLDRAFSSVYNLLVLGVMLAFLNGGIRLGSAGGDRHRSALYRAALAVFAVNAALVAVVWVYAKATGTYDTAIRALVLGLAGELPGVFGEYGRVYFTLTDWTVNGPVLRVLGLGVYATEGALLFLLLGLLGAVAAQRRRRVWLVVAIEVGIAVGLVLMASRTTLGAYLLSTLLLGALQRGRAARLAVIATPVLVAVSLVLLVDGGQAIADWFAARNSERLGSSDTRFLSYTTAAALVLAQNPLTGLGIKPVDVSLMEIPIGSHSTLSSMFTKGGAIGLLTVVTLMLTLLAGVVRGQAAVWAGDWRRLDGHVRYELVQLTRCVFVTLLWWITEDLDAPVYEAAMAGLCFGLMWAAVARAARRGNAPPAVGRW